MHIPRYILIASFLLVVLAMAYAVFAVPKDTRDYDGFAKCLTAKNMTLYGSQYCGHCSEQKDMFGASWQYVDYVECSSPSGFGQAQECADAGIQAYPTWMTSDGKQLLGRKSMEELSSLSGCGLPS